MKGLSIGRYDETFAGEDARFLDTPINKSSSLTPSCARTAFDTLRLVFRWLDFKEFSPLGRSFCNVLTAGRTSISQIASSMTTTPSVDVSACVHSTVTLD